MPWSGKEKLTPDEVVALLFRFSQGLVMGARQDTLPRLGVQIRSQLDKITDELLFFCFFALDYWVSDFISERKERETIREALYYHWREMLISDNKGVDHAVDFARTTERLKEYAQIVNEDQSDEAKFLRLGKKLSEFCGLGGNPFSLLLAADFFTSAMDIVRVVLRERK